MMRLFLLSGLRERELPVGGREGGREGGMDEVDVCLHVYGEGGVGRHQTGG